MTYAWKQDFPHHDVFSVGWLIEAPWAHPLWTQYYLALYDLTRVSKAAGPPVIHKRGATHEFMLYALDPEIPVPKDGHIDPKMLRLLSPPNYAYQFKAASDADAQARVQEIVDGIVAKHLSPDTDLRSLWNKLLSDMYPLVTAGFARP